MKKTLFLAAAIAAAAFGFAPAQAAPMPGTSAGVQAPAVVTTVAMHHRGHMMRKRHMMMKRHHMMRHHRRMHH